MIKFAWNAHAQEIIFNAYVIELLAAIHERREGESKGKS